MSLLNVLVSIVVAAFVVIVALWLVGMLVGVLPVIAVTLLKVLVVLIALGWLLGLVGSRPTWIK